MVSRTHKNDSYFALFEIKVAVTQELIGLDLDFWIQITSWQLYTIVGPKILILGQNADLNTNSYVYGTKTR